jgi:hypothetical protein
VKKRRFAVEHPELLPDQSTLRSQFIGPKSTGAIVRDQNRPLLMYLAGAGRVFSVNLDRGPLAQEDDYLGVAKILDRSAPPHD